MTKTRHVGTCLLVGVALSGVIAGCNHARPGAIASAPIPVPAATAPAAVAVERAPVTMAELTGLLDRAKNPLLDMQLRKGACWQLGDLKEEAAPIASELLKASSNDVLRPHVLAAIRAMGRPVAMPLVKALDKGDFPMRAAASTLLWDLGPDAKDAIPAIAWLAENGDREARGFAIDLLDGLAPYASAAEESLDRLQHDDETYIAVRAMSALERLRATADKKWVPAPMSKAEYDRRIASLNRIRPPLPNPGDVDPRPGIAASLGDKLESTWVADRANDLLHGSAAEQREALAALKTFAGSRPDARAAMLEAVKTGDPQIRSDAAFELAMLGYEAKDVAPVLEAALDQAAGAVQMDLAFALANVDPSNRKTVSVAMKVLEQRNEAVTFEALSVLAKSSPRPAGADSIASTYLLNLDFRNRDLAVKILESDGPQISTEAMANVHLIARTPDRADDAARGLLRLDDKGRAVVPRLLPMTRSDDLTIRSASLYVLSQIAPADPQFEAAIETGLDDGPIIFGRPGASEYRATALRAATLLPHPTRKILGPIITLSGSKDTVVAGTAMYAVRFFGPAVIREIQNTDLAYDSKTTYRIAGDLAPTIPGAIEIILKGMNDADTDIRVLSIGSFGSLGEVARPHIKALKPLLKDRSPTIRFAVLDALAKLGDVASEMSASLSAQVELKSGPVQAPGILTLARISPADPKVVPGLLAVIDRAAPDRRGEAVETFLSLDSKDLSYIPAVIKFLDDEDNTLRLQAVNALAKQGPRAHAASGRLSRMVDNEHADVRDSAARAMLRVEAEAPALLAAYLSAVRHRDSSVREMLAPAIRRLKPEASGKLLPRLNELAANDPDQGVRSDALSALRAIEGK